MMDNEEANWNSHINCGNCGHKFSDGTNYRTVVQCPKCGTRNVFFPINQSISPFKAIGNEREKKKVKRKNAKK